MPDAVDPFGSTDPLPRARTGPEQWLGAPDPLQSFESTVEQALHRLNVELAGLRAERDGLRLELEGVRTQLELTQQQIADRDRFTATVRELGQIVSHLTIPPVWTPTTAAHPIYDTPPVAYEPPVNTPLPPAPVSYEPIVLGAPLDVEPVPEPAAAVEPPVSAPAVSDPPMSSPPKTPEPTPVPASPFVSTEPTESYRQVDVGLETRRERFFDQPGTWHEEPASAGQRRKTFQKWATRVGTGIGTLVVATILLVSVAPKFLPFQTYFVRSGSMSPTFDTGDLIVLTKADASDLKQGDIITFDRPDRPGTLVTHRIVGVETGQSGKVFTTKGDANNDVDPWKVPASGSGWKYKERLPKVGFVFGYLGTTQARFLLLVIPAALLGILSLVDIWKPRPKATARRGR